MRCLVFAFSALCAIPVSTSAQDACADCTLPDDDLVRSIAPGVGRIDILTRQGAGYCTGFIVAQNIVATSWNCVPGPTIEDGYPTALASGIVLDYQRTDGKDAETRYLYYDPRFGNEQFGVSFLKLIDPKQTFSEDRVLKLSDKRPDEGIALSALVHLEGGPKTYLSEDCAVAAGDPEKKDLVTHTCNMGKGTLGAPLFNPETGEVVAIHLLSDNDKGLGVARSSAAILRVFPDLADQ